MKESFCHLRKQFLFRIKKVAQKRRKNATKKDTLMDVFFMVGEAGLEPARPQ